MELLEPYQLIKGDTAQKRGSKMASRRKKDLALWNALKQGSKNAHAEIYAQYFVVLFRYGIKIYNNENVVKDCIHDLFLKIWNRRDTISKTDNIKYYLFASLKNMLMDRLGKSARTTSLEGLFLNNEMFISTRSPEDKVISLQTTNEHKAMVLKALEALTQRQKQAIELKYFGEHSNAEIAEKMSISVEAVYNNIYKALIALRKLIPARA